MSIPQLYFGDIVRESSNYFLITECVPFAPRGRTEDGYLLDWRDFGPRQVLPKSGKYQDDRIVDAHKYYFALMRAMARMAAGDKIGAYDEHITVFAGSMSGPPPADTRQRREMMARRASGQMDVLIEFVTKYACNLFPAELTQPSLLARVKEQVVELSQYGAAAAAFLGRPELVALAHVNLQIDNAYFWRETEESTELECGLLDWYNLQRASAVGVWMGAFSGCEAEVRPTPRRLACPPRRCLSASPPLHPAPPPPRPPPPPRLLATPPPLHPASSPSSPPWTLPPLVHPG